MKSLQQTLEHGPAACVHSGDSLRCARSSRLQTRWAHSPKVYVPALAIVCAFLLSSAFAQSDDAFANANQEFAQGHFKEAISDYEALIRDGQWSANVFYDLGNAYFRAGDFGRAILNYERALALERHHPEATANLQIARDEAHALELTAGSVERVLRFASRDELVIVAAIAF